MEEDVGRWRVPEMVAQDFERPDECPSVWVELTWSHVQLGEEILLEEGERESETQPLEDG